MEYGNGNNGQYQPMEGYGMTPGETNMSQDMGQDFDRCYGSGMQSYDQGQPQGGSASFGGPGYRSPLRYTKMMREMNSRNGLYTPGQRTGRGNGDYYSSLPGIGGHEAQMYQSRNAGNQGGYY